MLTNMFTKALRDRWLGTTTGMVVVGAFMVLAMAAYQEIDISLYTDLPEGIRSVMGIPTDADSATLAYDIVFGLLASLTLAGLAVSIGAASVAGEERDGTIGILLGNPRSRRQLLVSKGGAMVALTLVGALVALGAAYLAPAVLDVDIGATDLVAVTSHLFLNALLWGTMAMTFGAMTGNRTFASAVTAGVMALCYFLVGLLPLTDAGADIAKALPWYWFDGHDPLNNGFAPGYAALQVGASVVLLALAWRGVEARDLTKAMGSRGVFIELADRVRSDERIARVIDRFSGSARVSRIWIKTATEGQALLLITSLVMFTMMGLLMGPMYAALEGTLAETSENLPDNLLAIAGGGDLTSPEGWYRLETFGLMAPIAVALVAGAVGARSLAGEERDRTMGLLLANPVSRRSIVLQKAFALVVHAAVVGVALFLGVVGGSILGGLGMSIVNVGAASLQVTLLGTMFGAVALAISAATGSVRHATVGTLGVFGAAYAWNAIMSIADSLDGWATLSPFEWYLGGDPLVSGIEWSSVVLFVGFTLVFLIAAVTLFDRRDLRRG